MEDNCLRDLLERKEFKKLFEKEFQEGQPKYQTPEPPIWIGELPPVEEEIDHTWPGKNVLSSLVWVVVPFVVLAVLICWSAIK